MELNPDGLRHHAAIKLRQRYNTPGIHIRVAISDDNDSFWDESKGPQVLGYAVYERSGKLKSDDLLDEGLWGRDGVFKSEFEKCLRRGLGSRMLIGCDRIGKKSSGI